MDDDYISRWGRVVYGGDSDIWGSEGPMTLEEIQRTVRTSHPNEKEELKLRVRDLEHEIHRLREKAKKKEKEFKEFRKLRKAIKADSVNIRMARLVKRI